MSVISPAGDRKQNSVNANIGAGVRLYRKRRFLADRSSHSILGELLRQKVVCAPVKKKKCHGVSASNDQIGGNVGIPSIDSTTGSVSVELLLLRCGLPMKDPLGVKDSRSASPSRPIPLSSSTEPFDVLVELAERKAGQRQASTDSAHQEVTWRYYLVLGMMTRCRYPRTGS